MKLTYIKPEPNLVRDSEAYKELRAKIEAGEMLVGEIARIEIDAREHAELNKAGSALFNAVQELAAVQGRDLNYTKRYSCTVDPKGFVVEVRRDSDF
jgi:hypothetical protein